MRVSESGDVYLLERHLLRLRQSARHFSFKYDSGRVRELIDRAAAGSEKPAYLRLTLSWDGETTLQSGPLPSGNAEYLKLSSLRVDSKDPFLLHKTSRRGIYEDARRECDERTDAILINERGEITETTVTNIAVFRDGAWITPALSCGLLPGVLRAELLDRGEIVEDIIPHGELVHGETVRCFNALRGKFDITFSLRPVTSDSD
jgi:branched-subunit amino acid aminotransferase/4-amino-4-deoxychorismate lyase